MMKITNVEVFHVKPRWTFVKISTDEGITGWGKRWSKAGPDRRTAIMEHVPFLIGQDPSRIEFSGSPCTAIPSIARHCPGQRHQRHRAGLWDIKGKSLEHPYTN